MVQVHLSRMQSDTAQSLVSDMGGMLKIEPVAPGQYSLILRRLGYYPIAVRLSVTPGCTVLLRVFMQNAWRSGSAADTARFDASAC